MRGPALLTMVAWFIVTASSCNPGVHPRSTPVPERADSTAGIPVPLERSTPPLDTEELFWPDPVERTRARLRDLQQLVLGFESRTGRMPDSLSDFLPPAGGPIDFAHDSWGHPFTYVRSGPDFVLRAPGPDGRAGTADDLVTSRDSVWPVADRRGPGTDAHLRFLRELLLVERGRTGKLPPTLADLLPPGVDDPRFARDWWGEAIRYVRGTSGFELRSSGADRVMGTGDDLIVAEEEIDPAARPPA